MNENIFEEQVSEYLRYNGFFLIRDFVIHFEDSQPQEIDFVGIRLPKSIEQTMYSNGRYSNFVFEEDVEKLNLGDTSNAILLIAEVTESEKNSAIKERISKLGNKIRGSYALQRLGVYSKENIDALFNGKSINYFGNVKAYLLRVLFILNDQIAIKYIEENNGITFISRKDVISFIKRRAKINIKRQSRALLPRWLHNYVDELLQR